MGYIDLFVVSATEESMHVLYWGEFFVHDWWSDVFFPLVWDLQQEERERDLVCMNGGGGGSLFKFFCCFRVLLILFVDSQSG